MTDASRARKRAPGCAEFLIGFGAHVKRLRERAGLTQEKLSAMTAIDRIALSNIETGDRVTASSARGWTWRASTNRRLYPA